MGKRKKGRCVKKNANINNEPEEFVQAPHSFIIHKGLPGGHILELTKDFRKVMEPFTATSLKERKKNSIKDFVSIAGPFHVSHLVVFSRTELGMYLKLARLPRGPTLTFRIQNFSLARDVVSSLKKQLVTDRAFKHSPLIILNNFSGKGMEMKLMTSMFQNMFPTINLTTVDLNTVRRCVLINYNSDTKQIDFRHYIIKVIPAGISKGVKKVIQGKVPDLSKCTDISDFFTKTGILSESEMEDDHNNQVTLIQKLVPRGNIESGKSAIKLSELGPRLTLELIKIEDGLMDGEVLYHDFIHKTDEEKAEIQKKRLQKKKLKEKRKKIQEQNKKLKETTKQELKEKSLKGMQKGKSETDIIMKKAVADANKETKVVEDNDEEYYKQEVGEEPEKGLFTQKTGIKRPYKTFNNFKNKKQKLNTGKDDSNKGNKRNFNKKFNKSKGKDKSNSENRDHRPIGDSKFYKFSRSKMMRNKS